MRYFVEFSYNGANYRGWQCQPNAVSVQQTINNALSVILRHPIETMGAGRTDAGVHARQMFAHFDFDEVIDSGKVIFKLNSYLPNDIAISRIILVHDDAHARFDALSREYKYYMHTKKNVFLEGLSYYLPKDLDVEVMNEATSLLLGKQDFQCFSKTHTDVNNYYCTISKANWTIEDDALVFTIEADRFLRNMVRAIVGTLLNIGNRKSNLADLKSIIENKNRSNAGVSVPAKGLFLTQIKYPYIN